jgi:imidazolonepropionase-like amidohydrolase/Tol biopolymer transport system component
MRRLLIACLALAPARAAAQRSAVDSVRAPTKLLEFSASEGTWMGVDVAPDGRTLVFDLLGMLYEMPIAGGAATPLTRGREFDHLPRYSPDGSQILFTSDRSGNEELWVLYRGRDSLERVTQFGYRAFGGTWAPDGRHIYLTTMDLGAKFAGHRIDRYGSKTELLKSGVFGTPSHFSERSATGKVYFSQPSGPLYQSGFQIKTYDLKTGEVTVYLDRPGGAADPVLSPDGRYLAYVHRQDLRTELVLHDLSTEIERVLVPNLDRDRMESGAGTTFGIYPNYAWHPNGQEMFYSQGGKIHAVKVADGSTRVIPFQAPVRRELAQTIRFPVTVPDGKARTRSHRFAQRTDQGILFAALGDLYLKDGDRLTNLTRSRSLETSPVYDAATKTVFYGSWTDDSLGAVWSLSLAGPRRAPTRLTTTPAQYGALTLSPDGKSLAFLRGGLDLNRGESVDGQDRFTLVVLGPDRTEREVGPVQWKADPAFITRLVPAIAFAPDGGSLYFDEIANDTLYLEQVRLDGMDRRRLVAFPHAAQAVPSPDLRWIAFREYFRTYLTPLASAGKPITISAFDQLGPVFRVDSLDGEDLRWSADSKTLSWVRGTVFAEKSVDEILAHTAKAKPTDLGFEYDVARPTGVVALTNARVITMDGSRRVLDRATIVVRENKIEAVGPDVAVPAGATVFDLQGKTVMPGMIDAHGHYNGRNSVLGLVEQNHLGLQANLAYGTTTLYEVYGNHLKDFLVGDLERSGAISGARLFSTGPPIYGLRSYRPRTFRPIQSQADADEVVGLNQAFGATALKDYVQFTRAARQRMYDAARRMGVNVVAESAVDFQMDWTMLMDGVTGIEHTVGLTPLYDDVRRLWSATAAGNTPTLIVSYNGPAGESAFHQTERLWEDPKLLRFFTKDHLIRFRRPTRYFDDDIYAVEMAAEIHRLAAAGVSVQVAGHGQMHGLDKHWEMELLSRGGFTPAEVLATATINSAKYLGLDRQLGSLEAGKLADLVILDANPLDEIRNTRRIDRVMLNGVIYRGTDATRLFPDPEPPRRPGAFRGGQDGVVGESW